MTEVEWLLKGILAGIAIAAPVGPVNVLCLSTAIAKGRRAGLLAGFGAATADTLYGSIAGFSISFVIRFLIREEFWIRLCGGILLLGIAAIYLSKPPRSLKKTDSAAGHSDYTAALLLNLTNPTTVLSFLAVLAALGLGEHNTWWLSVFLVVGIFIGSMLWWLLLVGVAHRFRHRFDDRATMWMNRVAGLAIGAFGAFTLFLARRSY